MLQRRGEHVVVFERGDIGAAWTTRYDRLHLHTIRWLSSLPGYRMPRAFGKWPSRDGVIEYLHRYADRTGVVVRTGVEVTRLDRDSGAWCSGLRRLTYPCRFSTASRAQCGVSRSRISGRTGFRRRCGRTRSSYAAA